MGSTFKMRRSTSAVVVYPPSEKNCTYAMLNNMLAECAFSTQTSSSSSSSSNRSNSSNSSSGSSSSSGGYDAAASSPVPIRIARVSGSLCHSDQQALVALAEQLMSVKSASFGLNFEALQTCFKHSCIDGSPTIIIVDDIHEFASRPRQVLLYALLDLIHRKECLFMVMVIHMQCYDIIIIQVMEHVDVGDWIDGPRGH